MKVREGDRVTILQGDEKGSWGIVKQIIHGVYHVGIAGGTDWRIFTRNEIRKSRKVA
jgi:ribosomal protein L24